MATGKHITFKDSYKNINFLVVQIAKIGGYRYNNGSVYVGDWNKKGVREGQGHLSFPDGSRYDGNFEENVFCGLGVLTFPDGAKYYIISFLLTFVGSLFDLDMKANF